MREMKASLILVVVGGMVVMAGCGASKETCTVTVSYTLQPTEQLPEGLVTVAVNEPEVEATEAGTEDADRAKKWSRMAADMMEDMIIKANKQHNTGLTIAKRRETKEIMRESDLQSAGLTQTEGTGEPAKLADVQGLIKSSLNIRNEVKKGTSRTMSAMSVAAWAGYHWGGGSGSMDTEQVENVSRNLTVQCSFSMYDKAGNPLFQYSPKPFRKHDREKPGFFMDGSRTEADLDPADGIIGDLVDQGVREFVGMFIPCPVEYKYAVESSNNKSSALGVRNLRAGLEEQAIEALKTAVADDPDDHRSWFCLGLAYEKVGQYDKALEAYRRAAVAPGLEEQETLKYTAAIERLEQHKDRIMKS